MSDDTTFSGWKNHATWCVNLHLSNNEEWQNERQAQTEDAWNDAPDSDQVKSGIWSIEEARRFNLAATLKNWVEEILFPDRPGEPQDDDLFQMDMLRGYLDDVNWNELADHAIADYAAELKAS